MFLCTPRRALLLTALSLGALTVAGCAGLGLPRIDPSGERVFVWPQNQVPPIGAPTNVQAPPVFTDSVFPQPILPAGQAGAGLLPPVPQDRLTISPNRILAPVGSEVILKAGLCTRESFLLTDSKVEWLLARDEVGEFVSLGGRGWCKSPWLPWNKPKKIDNHYATGYTAKVPLLITRGTADPSDDVQIEPGEAWASITSPVEGTSRITAVAPEIETWNARRATATIYWVDVQWTFPQPAITAGGSQVLTTTVRRHTDGTPIEGWLVRYEVANGSGSLRGSESGQVVEVPTDAQGRASIDVTPTGSAGSSTQINTQIVRPGRFQGSNAPKLVIANGASTIHWTGGGTDYLPTPDNLDNSPPVYPVPDVATPPIQRRGPKLEIEIRSNDSQVEVGQQASFEVLIRNVGDSPATGIQLTDTFDAGLEHPNDPRRFQKVERPIPDLKADEEFSAPMTFYVVKPGDLCQILTVTYDGGGNTQKQACIKAIQPQVQPQGQLEVRKSGPVQSQVGQTALFTLSIKNAGQAPLTNIEVVDAYDRALSPQPTPGVQIRDGNLIWSIPRIEIGETKRFNINCQCLAPKFEACSTVSVTADTGPATPAIITTDKWCTEILPGRDVMPDVNPAPGGGVFPEVTPRGGGAAAPAGPNATGPLRMELSVLNNSVLAGARTTFQVVVRNTATISDRQVRVQVHFPPELTPDTALIQNNGNVVPRFNNGKLVFDTVMELRPNEPLTFTIPCNANLQGIRDVTAEVISTNMPQGIRQTKTVEILAR